MQLTLRPYATAGVALVGAGVLAVAPLAPPMPDIQLPDVHTAAINLVASPFDLLTDAATNLAIIGANEINSPFMILQEFLANFGTEATGLPGILPGGAEIWSGGFIPVLASALGNAGNTFVGQLQDPPAELIPNIQQGLQEIFSGNVTGGVNDILHSFNEAVVIAGLPFAEVFPGTGVLPIPGEIFANISGGFDSVLSAGTLTHFLNALLGPGQSFLAGFADGIQGFVDTGSPLDLLGAPFQAMDGFVNGIPGALDGATGILQASFLSSTGGVGTLPFFNYEIPQLFANGLGAGFTDFNPDILTDGTNIFANFGDALEGMFGNTANILMSPIDLITELLGFSL